VRNEEVLHRVNEERNTLQTIKRRNEEGRKEGRIKVTGRQRRRR
jgi:hypothetical protein